MQHIHPFKGVRSQVNVPEGFFLVESGLSGFLTESSEALGFPFEAIHEAPPTATLVVDLPYRDLMAGMGKGYLLDFIDVVEAKYTHKVSLHKVLFPRWGSPIEGLRVLLVSSPTPLAITGSAKLTFLSDALPDVMFHSNTQASRGLFNAGLHSMYGYLPSGSNTLAAPCNWGDKYPLCEKRSGDSLTVGRLSKEDVALLWGYQLAAGEPLSTLDRLSPLPVLDSLLGALKASQSTI